MILNVSGRTDVVAFYTPWFMNRYKAGFFDVRNPFYPKQVSRINLRDVDAIVFCTKNPIPILNHLHEISKPILFQVTLTPYKKDIEPNVADKSLIIDAIKKVSDIVGVENVSVRYDPIFLSDKYDVDYHIKAFDKMCTLLDGYVKTIIVSFIDDYKNVRRNAGALRKREFMEEDYKRIGEVFSTSASAHGMTVQTCFEERNLLEYGFVKGDCVPHEVAYKLTGKKFKEWTARRGGKCGCVQMVDVGDYNSCLHLCKYCYANYDEVKVKSNVAKHDPNSSLLIGELEPDDIIKERVK